MQVTHVIADEHGKHIVSLGADRLVAVWSCASLASGLLTILSTFFMPQPPCHVAILGTRLFVVLRDAVLSFYPTVLYDLGANQSYHHHADDDHKREVTAATGSSTAGLFATAARDGCVKLWDADNMLVRIILFNESPSPPSPCLRSYLHSYFSHPGLRTSGSHTIQVRELSLANAITSCAFLNLNASLIVGVQHHLHCVKSEKFLPQKYRLILADHPQPGLPPPFPFLAHARKSGCEESCAPPWDRA